MISANTKHIGSSVCHIRGLELHSCTHQISFDNLRFTIYVYIRVRRAMESTNHSELDAFIHSISFSAGIYAHLLVHLFYFIFFLSFCYCYSSCYTYYSISHIFSNSDSQRACRPSFTDQVQGKTSAVTKKRSEETKNDYSIADQKVKFIIDLTKVFSLS